MFRKHLILSLLLSLIVSLCSCGPKEVIFPDANLETAIRGAISKPEGTILPSDLERLTSLDASKRDIVDITGLNYCTNLTRLYLNTNQISDILSLHIFKR